MPNVRNIMPKKDRELGAGRALRPVHRGMGDFFENYLPRRWMEGFFEPFAFGRPGWGEVGEVFEEWPKVDILNKEDALVVRAEMPGVRKEDLEIVIEGDRLVFEAKREFREKEEKEDYFRSEMATGRLYRAVYLPVEVDGDKAKAELKDGIIEVVLPKIEASLPHRVKVA